MMLNYYCVGSSSQVGKISYKNFFDLTVMQYSMKKLGYIGVKMKFVE